MTSLKPFPVTYERSGREWTPAMIFEKNADSSWTANGHMPLEDLVQCVPLPLDEKREYHTIAGLLMEYLQRIPESLAKKWGGGICLKRCRWRGLRVQKVQFFRCVRMARGG
ncbi:transporter associated domain-containing protein [Escherichia coli]